MGEATIMPEQEVDPELAPILAEQRERLAKRPSLESVTPDQMRRRAAEEFVQWNADPEPVASVRDQDVSAPHGVVRVRIYEHAPAATGTIVWLHGGGWVIGDLDLEDAALRRLARFSRVRIVSVDYRLAPEHPYPAALEDAEAVFCWLYQSGGDALCARRRIALGGASAGANLALAAALRLRDRGGPMPDFLLLMYGAYSGATDSESGRAFGDGSYGLTAPAMDYFWRCYAGKDAALADPYVAPLRADLRGLPPVFVNYAELDILRDDSLALIERLGTAAVPVEHRGYAGAIHGFTQYAKASGLARSALDDAAAALAAALS